MIVRRAGAKVESVEPHFNARALTEISFRPAGDFRVDTETFFAEHEQVGLHELTASAEGHVKDEVEQQLLRSLHDKVRALETEHEDCLVFVEHERGARDYPKTRDVTKQQIVRGENRLAFSYRVDPALRVSVYRKRAP